MTQPSRCLGFEQNPDCYALHGKVKSKCSHLYVNHLVDLSIIQKLEGFQPSCSLHHDPRLKGDRSSTMLHCPRGGIETAAASGSTLGCAWR